MAADQITDGLIESPASGIMGLAFSAISAMGSTPFWQALGSQLAAPEMAFYLARSGNDASGGGVFTLGGIDSTLFSGNIEYLAMPSGTPNYWLLNMSGECRMKTCKLS